LSNNREDILWPVWGFFLHKTGHFQVKGNGVSADISDMYAIAQNLRLARKQANLTQVEAEAKTGYSVRQIRRFEKEGTSDLDIISVFAEAYGTHPARIIFPREQWREVVLELTPPSVLAYFLPDRLS